MIAAIRSELRKYFSTRMWWGMALGCLAAGGLLSGLFAVLLTSGGDEQGGAMSPTDLATTVYTAGLQIGYLLTLVVGVLVIGAEFRHRTATATFLGTPKRVRVILAKVVALVVIAVLYGLVTVGSGFGVGAAVLSARGHETLPDSGLIGRSLALSLLVLVVWALIGLGVGTLIRNQVAAILVALGFAWILEPIASAVLAMSPWKAGHSIAKFLPSMATRAVTGGADPSSDGSSVQLLDWWQGSLVLLAYAAVAALLGLLLTLRRDI